MIRYLVNHAKASMSAKDNEGDTPLHLASAVGHAGAVSALCEVRLVCCYGMNVLLFS